MGHLSILTWITVYCYQNNITGLDYFKFHIVLPKEHVLEYFGNITFIKAP